MSEKAKAPAAAAHTDQPAKKGGTNRLIIIAGALVVLLGGGAAAYFTMRAPAAEEHAEEAVEEHEEKADAHEKAPAKKKKKKKKAHGEGETGLVSLEPFVVNLADPGGGRFLRVNVKIVIDSAAFAEHKTPEHEVLLVRLRSAILELLTQQTADQLVTVEGKEALKAAIAEHIEPLFEEAETEVEDVLFSDFVVQF